MSKNGTRGSSKPQKPHETRVTVGHLRDKIVGLKKLKDCKSTEAFIKALEQAHPKYRDKLKQSDLDRMIREGSMSGSYQEALGTFCGFDWDSHLHGEGAKPWLEGAADAFLNPLFYPPERQTHIVIKRAPGDSPVADKNGLASVEMLLGNSGKGQVDLGFEGSCAQATPLINMRATIQHAVLAVDCGRAIIDRATRKGFGTPELVVNGNGDNIRLTWSSGTSNRPRWSLDAGGKALGNFVIEPNFMRVTGLSPGDKLTVTLGVWRPDIGEADAPATKGPAPSPTDDVIALALQSGTELTTDQVSMHKRRFLERIASDAISNDGRFLTLATHTIKFIAQDDKS